MTKATLALGYGLAGALAVRHERRHRDEFQQYNDSRLPDRTPPPLTRKQELVNTGVTVALWPVYLATFITVRVRNRREGTDVE